MKLFYLISILFLCISCDIWYSYDRIVENNSIYDVWLISPNGGCSGLVDSILIPSNSSQTIDIGGHYGGLSNIYTSCPRFCTDTINSRIDTHDSLSLSFPIDRNTNWQITVKKDGCTCHLIINDSDIN